MKMAKEIKKTELQILGMARVEETNRYKINTSQGWMTAFMNEGDSLIEDLLHHTKQLISVGITTNESNGKIYKNIRNFYGAVAGNNELDEAITSTDKIIEDTLTLSNGMEIPLEPKRKSVKGSAYEKDPVGLAVEVCVAQVMTNKNLSNVNIVDMMSSSIDLVKQAQKAFS